MTASSGPQARALTSHQGCRSVPAARRLPVLVSDPGRAEEIDLRLRQLPGLRKEVGRQVDLDWAQSQEAREPKGTRGGEGEVGLRRGGDRPEDKGAALGLQGERWFFLAL